MNLSRTALEGPWLGALLLALAVSIGGCVAETGDEEEPAPAPTGVAASAQGYTPALPKDSGGSKSDPPDPGATPNGPAVVPGSDPGSADGQDPEPSPWNPPQNR